MRRIWHSFLLGLGCLSVALGVLGLVVPLLPTTPLLLLAAFCFARSSERFHAWLLNNRVFGQTIRNYRDGLGLPMRQKIVTLAILWVTVVSTSLLVVPLWPVRILLAVIASGVTVYLLSLPTRREQQA
ncbi:MAG TPA: YbaN family protein [Thermoanaerobaculia bacterium]|nr:YbaN family protein [Thermoanaerobaculia bacterium]